MVTTMMMTMMVVMFMTVGNDCYDCVGDVLVGLRAMGSQ